MLHQSVRNKLMIEDYVSENDHMKKTAIRVLLLTVFVIAVCVVVSTHTVFAEDTVASGYCGSEEDGINLTWTLDSDGVLTISGEGEMADYLLNTIPWLDYRSDILSIYIDDGITCIGEYAFARCDVFETVRLPKTVSIINEYAFYNCSNLATVDYGCTELKAEDIIIDNTNSGNIALLDAKWVFGTAEVQSTGSYGTNVNFILYEDGLLIISGSGSINRKPYSSWNNVVKRVVIEQGVTGVGPDAFLGCANISSVSIADSVISIDYRAFYGCTKLKSVNIPQGLTYLGEYAFYKCSSLSGSITIPNGVTSINDYTFYYCSSLDGIVIPDTVTSIGSCAFYGSGIIDLTIPESVRSISYDAFEYNKRLKSISIPDGVANRLSFSGCSSLISIVLPKGLTSVGYQSFIGCTSLKSVSIPYGVTKIDDYAFQDCSSLVSITIPETVEIIGRSAFDDCTSLSSIVILKGLSTVDGWAFCNCSLKDVYYAGSETDWSKITISSHYNYSLNSATKHFNWEYVMESGSCGDGLSWTRYGNRTLVLSGNGMMQEYSVSNPAPYQEYEATTEAIIIEDGITGVACGAFSNYSTLKEVRIAGTIDFIGEFAFCECDQLETVSLVSGVKTICEGAFFGCTGLKCIYIPTSIIAINADAFGACTQLSQIVYCGTESDWSAIIVAEGNNSLLNANMLFGHSWSTPVYTWSDDFSHVTARIICNNDSTHNIIETVETESVISKPATCESKGETTYTAVFNNSLFSTQSVTEENIDPLGHDYQTVITDPTCTDQGYTTHTCNRCGNSFIDEYVNELGHDYSMISYEWSDDNTKTTAIAKCSHDQSHRIIETVDTSSYQLEEASCEKAGKERYTAYFQNGLFSRQNKDVEIPALGHLWGDPDYFWAEDDISVSAIVSCTRNTDHVVSEISNTVYTGTEATLESDGVGVYTAVFQDPLFETQRKNVIIPRLIAINEVNFPDQTFRTYVKNNYDNNNDDCLSSSEIKKVTYINVDSLGIASLEGISFFTNITYLSCANNQLTCLDTSNNQKLVSIYCPSNQLESIDVTRNPLLERLYLDWNKLSFLDITNNELLTSLACSGNHLNDLDISNNIRLSSLSCYGNQLTVLDVSNNLELEGLDCSDNLLTYLDLSNNKMLGQLECQFNSITELIIPVYDTDDYTLWRLDCSYNQLTSLDLTNCHLQTLSCSCNKIKKLDISKCLWMNSLECSNNNLSCLDVSLNTELSKLDCAVNRLTSLDISHNSMLRELRCFGNGIAVLDISQNSNLISAYEGNKYDSATYYYDGNSIDFDHYYSDEGYSLLTDLSTPIHVEDTNVYATYIGASLTLKGNINMNFYVSTPEDGWTAVMIYSKDGSVRTAPLSNYVSSVGGYKVSYNNLAAKEMTEEVKLAIRDKDGNYVKIYNPKKASFTYEIPYSMVAYINLALSESTNDKEIAVLHALLNYGQTAQEFFNYNLEDPTNPLGFLADEMSRSADSFIDSANNMEPGDCGNYVGGSLVLKGDTSIRLYFDAPFTAKINGADATVVRSGKNYYVEKANIASKDLDTKYVFEITIDGRTYIYKYCALSWCNTTLSNPDYQSEWDVCKALYLYNEAANNFF